MRPTSRPMALIVTVASTGGLELTITSPRLSQMKAPPTLGIAESCASPCSIAGAPSGHKFLEFVEKVEAVDHRCVLPAQALQTPTDPHLEVRALELEGELGDGVAQAIAEPLAEFLGQRAIEGDVPGRVFEFRRERIEERVGDRSRDQHLLEREDEAAGLGEGVHALLNCREHVLPEGDDGLTVSLGGARRDWSGGGVHGGSARLRGPVTATLRVDAKGAIVRGDVTHDAVERHRPRQRLAFHTVDNLHRLAGGQVDVTL